MYLLSLTEHYASDYSVFMALVDLIPVVFFFAAGLFLMRDLYNKLNRWSYGMLSAGTIMVLIAGLLKAVWKILCALNVTDFVVLNLMMMPLQAIGFVLASVSLLDIVKKKINVFVPITLLFILSEAPLEMTNKSMPFLILQTLGGSMLLILLMIISGKMKNKLAVALLIVSFITMWGMGGLAAVQDKMSTTLWNWLEEIDNTVSQGTLFFAVYVLHKNGLDNEKLY